MGGPTVRSSFGLEMDLPQDAEGTVITRAFRGKPDITSANAAEFLAHVQPLGWTEVSRTYTPGSYGCGAFLVALLLALVLVGILIFIYLLVVKPDGTLVVTYTRTPAP